MKLHFAFTSIIGFSVAATWLSLPCTLRADTAVVQQVKEESPAAIQSFTRSLFVRGYKLRMDSKGDSKTLTFIYDLEAGKRYRLDPKRKEVYVADLSYQAKVLQGTLILQQIKSSIRPTGSDLEIDGIRCREFEFDLQAPAPVYHSRQIILHDAGTACLSLHVTGATELTSFVREARKRGYFSAAALFSPTDSVLGAFFYGDESDAMLMFSISKSEPESRSGPLEASPFARMEIKTVSVKTQTFPDDTFRIPPDWKVKQDSLPPSEIRIFR